VADGISYSIPIGDAIESLTDALFSKNSQNVLDDTDVVATRSTLDANGIEEAISHSQAEKTKSADSSHDGSSFLPHFLPERDPVMISRR
jgi:hypothetical protein